MSWISILLKVGYQVYTNQASKQGKSTETFMLHLTEKWKQALEENKVVGVLFIDFKKAFDSICHR